jgi:seryl-tRNA synthetase
VPQQAPLVKRLEIEACRHTGGFRKMIDKGAFQQAKRENNRVKKCLAHLSEKDSLSLSVLKQEADIYATLLDGIMARDKQNQALLQKLDSMEKTAKKLQKKIKGKEMERVRLRGVEKENARLKQQIKSYKAIDLGLDTINPKPGGNFVK